LCVVVSLYAKGVGDPSRGDKKNWRLQEKVKTMPRMQTKGSGGEKVCLKSRREVVVEKECKVKRRAEGQRHKAKEYKCQEIRPFQGFQHKSRELFSYKSK